MGRRSEGSVPLFVAISCWLFGLLYLLGTSSIAWALKDGLGPDAVESQGWLALTRFWSDGRSGLLVSATILLVGCLFYWWDVRRSA